MGIQRQICNTIDLSKIKVTKEECSGFNKILNLQHKLASRFYRLKSLSNKEKTAATKEFILCIQAELIELLEEMDWKHWKSYDDFEHDVPEIHYELIDILHFWLDLCLIWGLSGEKIMKIYLAKNKINHERQKNSKLGYINTKR